MKKLLSAEIIKKDLYILPTSSLTEHFKRVGSFSGRRMFFYSNWVYRF